MISKLISYCSRVNVWKMKSRIILGIVGLFFILAIILSYLWVHNRATQLVPYVLLTWSFMFAASISIISGIMEKRSKVGIAVFLGLAYLVYFVLAAIF